MRSNSKYYNTAIKMDEALLTLLQTKEFDYITVKDICSCAEVNRSTFYLHYENTIDLLEETIEYISTRFNEYFKGVSFDYRKINEMPLDKLYLMTPEYLNPMLEFSKENRKLFLVLNTKNRVLKRDEGYLKMFNEVLSPILTRFGVKESEKTYMISFYIEGVRGVVNEWLKNGCKEEVSVISKLILSLIIHYEK